MVCQAVHRSLPHVSPHSTLVCYCGQYEKLLRCGKLATGSWLVEATEQLHAFSAYFLHELHLNQMQLDELDAVLNAVRDVGMSAAEAIERFSRAPHWVWTAIDPESKLLLAVNVGDRTLAMAPWVVHQVVQRLAPDCVLLFLTDGFREYLTALVTHCGHWVQPPRRQARGAAPQPRWMPLPTLLDAQVVKIVRRRVD